MTKLRGFVIPGLSADPPDLSFLVVVPGSGPLPLSFLVVVPGSGPLPLSFPVAVLRALALPFAVAVPGSGLFPHTESFPLPWGCPPSRAWFPARFAVLPPPQKKKKEHDGSSKYCHYQVTGGSAAAQARPRESNSTAAHHSRPKHVGAETLPRHRPDPNALRLEQQPAYPTLCPSQKEKLNKARANRRMSSI